MSDGDTMMKKTRIMTDDRGGDTANENDLLTIIWIKVDIACKLKKVFKVGR